MSDTLQKCELHGLHFEPKWGCPHCRPTPVRSFIKAYWVKGNPLFDADQLRQKAMQDALKKGRV